MWTTPLRKTFSPPPNRITFFSFSPPTSRGPLVFATPRRLLSPPSSFLPQPRQFSLFRPGCATSFVPNSPAPFVSEGKPLTAPSDFPFPSPFFKIFPPPPCQKVFPGIPPLGRPSFNTRNQDLFLFPPEFCFPGEAKMSPRMPNYTPLFFFFFPPGECHFLPRGGNIVFFHRSSLQEFLTFSFLDGTFLFFFPLFFHLTTFLLIVPLFFSFFKLFFPFSPREKVPPP